MSGGGALCSLARPRPPRARPHPPQVGAALRCRRALLHDAVLLLDRVMSSAVQLRPDMHLTALCAALLLLAKQQQQQQQPAGLVAADVSEASVSQVRRGVDACLLVQRVHTWRARARGCSTWRARAALPCVHPPHPPPTHVRPGDGPDRGEPRGLPGHHPVGAGARHDVHQRGAQVRRRHAWQGGRACCPMAGSHTARMRASAHCPCCLLLTPAPTCTLVPLHAQPGHLPQPLGPGDWPL